MAEEAEQHDAAQRDHVHIGREGEHPARLPHAAQVAPGDQRDAGDRHRHDERGERRRAGHHRRDPAGHAHRDGEHVVQQQRCARDLGQADAEVVLGDDVGAARRRVGGDRLPVGQDQDGKQDGDADRDREGQRGRRRPGDQQRQHDLLGAVGAGGDVVGCQHRQRDQLAQPLVHQPRGRQRRAEHQPLEPVDRPGSTGGLVCVWAWCWRLVRCGTRGRLALADDGGPTHDVPNRSLQTKPATTVGAGPKGSVRKPPGCLWEVFGLHPVGGSACRPGDHHIEVDIGGLSDQPVTNWPCSSCHDRDRGDAPTTI